MQKVGNVGLNPGRLRPLLVTPKHLHLTFAGSKVK
jgi:hypothetical protein